MNHLEMSNRLLLEELLSLESMIRMMKDRQASDWMLNNIRSLLYSLKSRAFLAKKLSIADLIHFMQKLLYDLPLNDAIDLLLEALELCIQAFDDQTTSPKIQHLLQNYENYLNRMNALPRLVSQ